ncbi:MAG: xanthine dehydrogenase family protein molybdopterin-binding subunit, partial [Halobacteriales archaeon]
KIPLQQVQVSVPNVGGGFGLKNKFHPAEALAAWSSVQLGRPVAWQATRTESFRSDVHGRARRTTAALACDADGNIQGLRVDQHADVGAYVSKNAGFILTAAFGSMVSGQYEIPAIHCRIVGAFTNGTPVDAYRGAGRPESSYTIERLVRRAAAELAVDPAAFRRQNQIDPDAFPYETPVGAVYDSGEYERAMETALEQVDYEGFRDRQAEARAEDTYLGLGIANLTERSGTPHPESSAIRIHPTGTVTAYLGTMDTGQGHETTFAQILSDQLGVPVDDVRIVEGDTEQVPEGTGSFGSRSTMMAGNALLESSRKVLEDAREVAAHALEASVDDLVFEDGQFAVKGAAQRSIDIAGVAEYVYGPGNLPPDIEPGLTATTFYRTETTYPFGTHIAIVEVDADSWEVSIEQYIAVDDCGVQINPKLVDGQIHGSVAQGIGQALYEEVQYNDTGTAVAGSLSDYVLPSAGQLPEIEVESTETPSPRNELGVKGIGESGCIAAPPAVVNAVVDALEPFGVQNVQMPVSPETVWQAVRDADTNGLE